MKTDGSNAVATANQQPKTMGEWLKMVGHEVAPSIPKGTVGADRFIESVKLALFDPKNPNLLKCTHESQKRAIIQAANYGLEVGGVLGQSYFIPYEENVKDLNGNWHKEMICHFQMGYKGLIELARRSNTIKTIAAECIYANDDFDCELASGRSIHHKMNIFKERGEVIGYYCLVELANGGEQFAIMSKSDAEKFRDTYSKSYIMAKDKSQQNWGKNFDAMALKTVVIKALKLCPISIEALRAVQEEEISDYENPEDVSYVEATVQEIPQNEVKQIEQNVYQNPPVQNQQPEYVQNSPIQNNQQMNFDAGVNAAFDNLPKSNVQSVSNEYQESNVPEGLF